MEVDGGNQEETLRRFAELTGVSEARSRYFLEAAAWDFEVAAGTYFETLEDDVEIVEDRPDLEILEPSPVPIVEEPPESDERYLSSSSDDEVSFVGSQSASREPPKQRKKMSGKKFATLHDNKKEDSDSGGEGEGRDKPQTFFAGGGQEIVGPKRDKKPADPNELVADVFQRAKEHGAEAVDQSTAAPSGSGGGGGAFQGGAYRLGDSVTPGEAIQPPPGVARAIPDHRRLVAVVLRMWENGFSLDDGPLRPYDHPSSEEFLDSIKDG